MPLRFLPVAFAVFLIVPWFPADMAREHYHEICKWRRPKVSGGLQGKKSHHLIRRFLPEIAIPISENRLVLLRETWLHHSGFPELYVWHYSHIKMDHRSRVKHGGVCVLFVQLLLAFFLFIDPVVFTVILCSQPYYISSLTIFSLCRCIIDNLCLKHLFQLVVVCCYHTLDMRLPTSRM